MLHPSFNSCQTGIDVGKGWVMEGFGAEVDLSVISIAVEVQVEVAEYLTEGEDVNDEEEGAKY